MFPCFVKMLVLVLTDPPFLLLPKITTSETAGDREFGYAVNVCTAQRLQAIVRH
jgi:hypothetical protein